MKCWKYWEQVVAPVQLMRCTGRLVQYWAGDLAVRSAGHLAAEMVETTAVWKGDATAATTAGQMVLPLAVRWD